MGQWLGTERVSVLETLGSAMSACCWEQGSTFVGLQVGWRALPGSCPPLGMCDGPGVPKWLPGDSSSNAGGCEVRSSLRW